MGVRRNQAPGSPGGAQNNSPPASGAPPQNAPPPAGQPPGSGDEYTAIFAMLKSSVLFRGANDVALQFIASQLKVVVFKKGEAIFLENEIGDNVYFVKTGSVEIVKYNKDLKQINRLAILKPGTNFAEFSVLNNSNKSASAYAFEDAELYSLDGQAFLNVLRRFPLISKQLAVNLAEINRSMSGSQVFVEYFKSASININMKIPAFLPANSWAKHGVLPLSLKGKILTVAMKDPYNQKFYAFLQSQQPSLMIAVCLINETDFEETRKQLQAAYSGQSADFGRSKKKGEEEQAKDLGTLVCATKFFASLQDGLFQQLLPHFQQEAFKEGQTLFKPGQENEYLYLVQGGSIELTRPLPKSSGHVHIVSLESGSAFGEVSLITGQKHTTEATATGNLVVHKLHKNIFVKLMETPDFSVPVCQILAERLSKTSQTGGMRIHDSKEAPDFDAVHGVLPRSIMEQHKILPLSINENELILGTVHPENDAIYSIVSRYLSNYRVSVEALTTPDYDRWSKMFARRFDMEGGEKKAPRPRGRTGNTAVQKLEEVLKRALRNGSSDLHIEPFGEAMTVRYRIDGVLKEDDEKIPIETGRELINRLKVLANMDITNHMVPQDGQIQVEVDEQALTARVSTLPTKFGENAVLRLIKGKSNIVPLNMLAPDSRTMTILNDISKLKQGLFLVTGPTGSGKTTTLYSMIDQINKVGVNIITLEDPVEMVIPGTTQVQMNVRQGLDFVAALKSVLRQDPDVVMVGEIRDEESAKIVFEAAITGHLVISTLHTNSALDVAPRLHELGVPTGTLAAGLVGVTAQRLVRSICQSCRSTRDITPEEEAVLREYLPAAEYPKRVVFGKGCDKCERTGYRGRVPVFEIWRKTRATSQVIVSGGTLEEMYEAVRKDGFVTLFEFGLKMALNGLTTIEEVIRVLPKF